MIDKIKQFLTFEWCMKYSVRLAEKYYDGNNEEELKSYKYFFYGVLSTAIWLFSTFIIALAFDVLIQYLCVVLSFCVTRRLVGGHHEETHFRCFIDMNIFITVFSLFAKISINYYWLIFIIAFGLTLSKNYCVPKKTENTLDYSNEDIYNFRKKYSIITSVLYFIIATLCLVGYKYNIEVIKTIVSALSYGIIMSWFFITDFIEKLSKFIWKNCKL